MARLRVNKRNAKTHTGTKGLPTSTNTFNIAANVNATKINVMVLRANNKPARANMNHVDREVDMSVVCKSVQKVSLTVWVAAASKTDGAVEGSIFGRCCAGVGMNTVQRKP